MLGEGDSPEAAVPDPATAASAPVEVESRTDAEAGLETPVFAAEIRAANALSLAAAEAISL